LAGYKGVKRVTDGRLPLAATDVALAVLHAGVVLERSWLDRGTWHHIEA
jgi:hypothetical protein